MPLYAVLHRVHHSKHRLKNEDATFTELIDTTPENRNTRSPFRRPPHVLGPWQRMASAESDRSRTEAKAGATERSQLKALEWDVTQFTSLATSPLVIGAAGSNAHDAGGGNAITMTTMANGGAFKGATGAGGKAGRLDLLLLNWLSGVEKSVEVLDKETILLQQPTLTTNLLSILVAPAPTSSQPRLKPGRPARALLSRIFLLLLAKGDTKGLYDLVQSLIQGMVGSELKGAGWEREKENRLACAWVLGEVLRVWGGQVMSTFIDVVTTATRIGRTASYPVILRCAALVTLRKAIVVGARSMSEPLIKETLKALRAGLSEKIGAIVRESANCLIALQAAPGTFTTLADIDAIVQICFRTLETADHVARRALSRLVASLLASTQVEGSGAPPILSAPPRRRKKTGGAPGAAGEDEDDDDDPYPSVGVPAASANAAKTLLSPIEMLVQLSAPYNKLSTSRKLRNAIIDVYGQLLTSLGASWVEQNYAEVLQHLIDEIGCGVAAGTGWKSWHPRMIERIEPSKAKYEALAARKSVGILLRDIISGRLLSESAQILAVREIGQLYLKRWPSLLPSQVLPSKQALVIALEETSGLLAALGCAPMVVQNALYDPLLRLVSHPSHSVQIAAAWALRTFCDNAPTRLSATIVQLVELLNKDLAVIAQKPNESSGAPGSNKEGGTPSPRRAVGHAHALAALINLIPHQPLYVSFDISAKCMSLAIQLLKQSANHELIVSGVEIHVAWILVSALMSLGPNFVRLHLPQLLILWRNALPKPTSKDASAAQVRGENEWAFLLHIRECTLGAILSFLRHNGGVGRRVSNVNNANGAAGEGSITATGLISDDVGRRLVLLLSNGLSFASSFQLTFEKTLLEQHNVPAISSRLSLYDRDLMLRRRLLQCFVALGHHPATAPWQVTLLTQIVPLFSDPEHYTGESMLQAAVNSPNFTSVWEETDGFGYGVTSLMKDGETLVASHAEDPAGVRRTVKLNRDVAEMKIEQLLKSAVLGAAEYDPLVLSSRHHSEVSSPSLASSTWEVPSAPPTAIGLVDAGIELFAIYFSTQEHHNQGALLQILQTNLRSGRLEKNPGRRMAILANSITAIVGALRLYRRAVEPQVGTLMRDIIKDALLHPDAHLRAAAAESLGRLSSLGETSFMATQIQFCVNQVVSNTDPDNRAGCALAFGEIYRHVGSLAAGPVLKTIVDVLLSLSADPHPLVHFYALHALSLVIDAASLSYAPFTNATLGMLSKLYTQDTHEPEGGTPGSVNLRGDLPAYQAICRVMDALIGVLGPELQDSERVRDLVLLLLREFVNEEDDGIAVEAIKATQHLLMFAPDALNRQQLVATLRGHLSSSSRHLLKVAAVNSVYQLVQRDAASMSKVGGDGMVQQLFELLDDDPSIEGVRDAITSWLRQTAEANPSGWIDLCQRIMSRSTGAAKAVATAAAAASSSGGGGGADTTNAQSSFADEEIQGLGLDDGGLKASKATSRWRTQLFALQCLHEVFVTVAKSGRREHFDIARARVVRANRRGLLITRVGDLIKMAFTASTAQVMQIRLEGLVVLRDVIEGFGQSQDIDFEEALLLEQFQAPIAAALTPAFSADSYPEVLASAIHVCAVFVGSGVVKEIDRMGRILKLLTTALESCRESDMSSIGDVQDLSSTAAVMLKTSIFAAWAQFQSASVKQAYLAQVIEPHLPLLCPLWVGSLREYARVRTDPDATSSDSGAGGAAFDSVYSGLSRETALPFYERSWPQMLHAVGTLLKAGNAHMLRAVDGKVPKATDSATNSPPPPPHRTQPAEYFWVLFGLSYEALCATPPPAGTTSPLEVQTIALEALAGLIRPQVSGPALVEKGLFDEVCNLCYRLAITEGPEVKVHVMDIAVQMARNYEGEGVESGESSLAEDSKMRRCLQIATCVLRESVPSTSSSPKRESRARYTCSSDLALTQWSFFSTQSATLASAPARITLLRSAFSSFADLADIYPASTREELYAIAFYFYSQLLQEEASEIDLVSPTLPMLKALCDRSQRFPPGARGFVVLPKVINGMLSACLQNIDSVRGRRGAAAILKTRNNLLAAVLLLTSLGPSIQVGQEVVEHACFIITSIALSPSSEVLPTALHCLTSILPTLIEFVAKASRTELQAGDPALVQLAEVLKALVVVLTGPVIISKKGLFTRMPPHRNPIAFDPPAGPHPPSQPSSPSASHTLAIKHLIQLASSNSSSFKEATFSLSEEQRTTLETSIRAQVGGTRRVEVKEEAPKISLKMFG
ncbi:BQ5605_C001g00003 [Microbotryum silenes-dioicae]|uniref:BQ5605_C001g00003 protein n=1 Tax=Microbotryum silenes-dioicae TaxID=796604 RepID=A0A2X0M1Z3_9BASI|nr:BQ5605_C001g00003 [Microbotryum silenes-dioicae]